MIAPLGFSERPALPVVYPVVMSNAILAVVDDLFFLSKIQQVAKLAGINVEPVDPHGLAERSAQGGIGAVIVDLNHRSGAALDVLRGIRADPALSQARTVGFVSHVQADLAAGARAAGCDTVMARSAFSQQLPQLLKELAERR